METVLRALVIYGFLFLLFRITGKRSLGQITTFDFVLLLVIGEATQQGLLGDDFSITNALLVIVAFIVADVTMAWGKQRWYRAARWIEDVPLLIVDNGRPLRDRMDRARIDLQDLMEAARLSQGLERVEQIKYAVLERNGAISIIPKSGA